MAVADDDDFVEDIGEMIEYTASLLPESTPDGMALAAAVKNMIREKYKGDRVWIRQRRHLSIEDKAKIKTEFDGTNLAEIMERYQVSRSTVYRIAR